MEWVAATEAEMRELGRRHALDNARPGSVIALIGGLGAGKTQWVKGFAAGLGCTGDVSSPTFGLLHCYDGGRLPLFHYDFYRLQDDHELLATGWDEILDARGVVIAEWGNLCEACLPPDTEWLVFQTNPDGSRLVRHR